MATRKRASSQVPAHLLLGADAYLREERREAIVRETVPEEARDFAVARFSLERTRLGEILAQAETRPMLGERQVLVIGDADRIREEDLEVLEKYFKAPAEFSVLVFEAESLDRRTRAARLLLAKCELFEPKSDDNSRAVQKALEFAREFKIELDTSTAEGLVLVLGSDLGLLKSELSKLRAYAGPGGRVTMEEVAAVVAPARKFGVFDLIEPLAEHRREEALVLLRKLLEGEENPVGMVGALAWLYRQLLLANLLGPEARWTLRARRDHVELLLRQGPRFPLEDLRAAFADLHDADVALKSLPPDSNRGIAAKHATLILEALVAKLAGGRPAGARAPRAHPPRAER
ncbi:MAG: DNA polymerase III subunit delta [Candidatus Acidiferrales bacterium]